MPCYKTLPGLSLFGDDFTSPYFPIGYAQFGISFTGANQSGIACDEANEDAANALIACEGGAEDSRSALSRGAKYLSVNRDNEAAKCFDAAISTSPESLKAHRGRTIVAGSLKDYRREIQEYRSTLDLMPRLYEAHIGLGLAQRLAGDLDAADITLNPKNGS